MSTSKALTGEQYFHGEDYHEGPWNSAQYGCCRLCKTRNPRGKTRHWAKGLCRSCYRRLSLTHRLYNDRWNKVRSSGKATRREQGRKRYKDLNPRSLKFSDIDVETLLDRYGWKCAYSGIQLQGHDHKKFNAFQLEYLLTDTGRIALVPVARKINCSKKSLQTEAKLKEWALKNGIKYPFSYITVEDYYKNL